MTNTKHTPGPWVIGDIRGLSADGIPIRAYNRAYDDYHAILNITTPHTGDAVANAHIIAAAPDMKAALIDAERWLGFLIAQEIHKDSSSPNHARQTLKRVTDAINKAEGRLAQ